MNETLEKKKKTRARNLIHDFVVRVANMMQQMVMEMSIYILSHMAYFKKPDSFRLSLVSPNTTLLV